MKYEDKKKNDKIAIPIFAIAIIMAGFVILGINNDRKQHPYMFIKGINAYGSQDEDTSSSSSLLEKTNGDGSVDIYDHQGNAIAIRNASNRSLSQGIDRIQGHLTNLSNVNGGY